MHCAKTLIKLAAAVAACIITAVMPQKLAFAEGSAYTFFCGNTSADCRIITAENNALLYKLTLKDICGECTVYETLDIDNFLQSADGEIIFTEELSDSTNYYCKANLPYSVTLYGTEINLHICVKESGVTVASPIIFGGY